MITSNWHPRRVKPATGGDLATSAPCSSSSRSSPGATGSSSSNISISHGNSAHAASTGATLSASSNARSAAAARAYLLSIRIGRRAAPSSSSSPCHAAAPASSPTCCSRSRSRANSSASASSGRLASSSSTTCETTVRPEQHNKAKSAVLLPPEIVLCVLDVLELEAQEERGMSLGGRAGAQTRLCKRQSSSNGSAVSPILSLLLTTDTSKEKADLFADRTKRSRPSRSSRLIGTRSLRLVCSRRLLCDSRTPPVVAIRTPARDASSLRVTSSSIVTAHPFATA